MYKYLAGLITLILLGYLGYKHFTEEKLDARSSINEGIKQVKKDRAITPDEEKLLRLQMAVVSYLSAKGAPPTSLNELVPVYLDRIPEDPATGEPYAYRREGKKYFIGQQAKPETQVASLDISGGSNLPKQEGMERIKQLTTAGDFVNPNTMPEEEFVYNAAGRRDPFLPFDYSGKTQKEGDVPPLERYKLGQLRFVAVVADTDGNLRGSVEDEQGRGYSVVPGTRIGDSGGVVVKIEKDRLKILETTKDVAGEEKTNVAEMVIQKKSK